ncbi:MAG: hypothetical protein JSC189_000626 [Candidatus Tokpelaia sp. JSC189]|nr:MAG: hypothetical protein JSC189_000626 [Candidatus Tokpelaia sp. JSC189]
MVIDLEVNSDGNGHNIYPVLLDGLGDTTVLHNDWESI